MTGFEEYLKRYDYELKPEKIALTPVEPRDSSKVLVYDHKDGTVREDTFRNIAQYLPRGSILIFNDTKVVPARLPGTLSTGGKVELLCTSFQGREITALCERFLRNGVNVAITSTVSLNVVKKVGSVYSLSLEGAEDIRPLLEHLGATPLPPYLKNSPLSEGERREKYQAIFAKNDGSIAAPTASLHFTKTVVQSLEARGIKILYVTLHVNLGTFMPLTVKNIESGELHEEFFQIPRETLEAVNTAKSNGTPVIAVGTTALRAIESVYSGANDSTRLFIREGYEFKAITGFITNFHVPQSSLMMLVSTLVGRERLLTLYAHALENDYRFLSFGDAMLIL